MEAFITSPGTVRESRIWKPLVIERQPVWMIEMDFEEDLPKWSPNTRLGRYRFISMSAPDVYDATGKRSTITTEFGEGSVIRIAGEGYLNGPQAVLVMNAVSTVTMVEPKSIFTMDQR